jgi:hypothetical protein
MMPQVFPLHAFKWKPVEHEGVDLTNWRWKNYPKLYSLDLPFEKKKLKENYQKESGRQVKEEVNCQQEAEELYDQI